MDKPIKIAYLVMAYHQPELVARMVRRLDDGNAQFFVHVDRKVDILPFRRLMDAGNIVFAEDRHVIHWGGWNMVEATLGLMRLARQKGKFNYFQLLSDSCYPIKSNKFIQDKLASSTKNFITVNQCVGEHSSFRWWIRNYHLPDLLELHTFEKFRIYKMLRNGLAQLLPRRLPGGNNIYKGWQWWCLTNECVEYILRFVSANRGFTRYFRFVRIPDEMFFQTVLVNSRFADSLSPGFDNGHIAGNHYIEWEDGRPVTLREPQMGGLVATSACFARKFSMVQSMSLIERLDALSE